LHRPYQANRILTDWGKNLTTKGDPNGSPPIDITYLSKSLIEVPQGKDAGIPIAKQNLFAVVLI